jgi:hypothetical protein
MSNVTPFSQLQPRRKQLVVTDAMLEQIKRVADVDLSADDIVVFEAVALNTAPLNKRGSIFDQARASRALLEEMADALNTGKQSVPLHTLHMQGSELPVGKLFQAYLYDTPEGETELRAQFYIPKSESALIEKLNLAVLDEVSVGLKSRQLLCSKCGFDYFGPESDFMYLLMQTCENDHTIGVDGTHTKLVGLDAWMELSLVSRGAAEKPKILSRAKSLLPQGTQDKIAASGFIPEATVLFASPSKLKEEAPMADEKDKAVLAAAPASVDLSPLEAKLDTLIELLTAKQEEPAPVTASEDEEEDSELEALKAEIADLKSQVAELSRPKAEDLKPDLPVGGVAASAIIDAVTKADQTSVGAFKSRKSN